MVSEQRATERVAWTAYRVRAPLLHKAAVSPLITTTLYPSLSLSNLATTTATKESRKMKTPQVLLALALYCTMALAAPFGPPPSLAKFPYSGGFTMMEVLMQA